MSHKSDVIVLFTMAHLNHTWFSFNSNDWLVQSVEDDVEVESAEWDAYRIKLNHSDGYQVLSILVRADEFMDEAYISLEKQDGSTEDLGSVSFRESIEQGYEMLIERLKQKIQFDECHIIK